MGRMGGKGGGDWGKEDGVGGEMEMGWSRF